jgi:transglutaminase-like putative cysteine protease
MQVSIPKLVAGETAQAIVTYEIEKSWIEEPASLAGLRLPKTSRDLAKFLGPSPYIESNDAKIKRVAAAEADDDAEPWQQAHKLFTWTRANVKYKFAEAIKPAVEALQDGEGDCEELSSLFIALCRNRKIPARAVWVPGHTYPEFYLEDANGNGHWYPCQAAGEAPDFGRMPEDRPILQKGDNLKIPGESSPQRYARQKLKAKDAAAPPKVKFVMEAL